MLKAKEINEALVTKRFASAFGMHVGRGKALTVEQFCQITGFESRSVGGWIRGESSPYLFRFLSIASVLPPPFLNQVIEISGLHGAYETEGTCDSYMILSKAAHLVAKISTDAEDGKIDHIERSEQVPLARELHALLGKFLEKTA